MADFVQSSETKSAIRTLESQIADVATFNSIVQSVITDNPFACVSYMTAGVTHDPVEKTRESYTVKVVYQDTEAKTVGTDSSKFGTIDGFTAGAAALAASAALITAHGGSAVRDADNETYSATLRCHDANGELFNVTFSRKRLTLTSYSDEAIRTNVEAWADTVATLA
ncbi:MAG: hypothetical protein Q7V05_11575 [Methanoregula sp.]|nr:hypothetical protein [Methanoregula sp.]